MSSDDDVYSDEEHDINLKKRKSTVPDEELDIIVPKKKKKAEEGVVKKKKGVVYVDRQAVKAAKEQARLVKKLQFKKQLQEERQDVLDRLQKAQSKTEMKYYKSSAKLGQSRSTKKEALKRALMEERAGLQRSEPEVALYQEREQIVDFTVPLPVDNSAQEFIAQHADLLKQKTPKKKKVKVAKPKHAARQLKANLFSVVESSSSDSEGDIRRKELMAKHKNDASVSSSSVSDISSSSVSDIESSSNEPNLISSAPGNNASQSDSSSDVSVKDSKSSKTTPSTQPSSSGTKPPTSGFVIPSFAAPLRTSKTALTTASSTKRRLERHGVAEDSAPVKPAPTAAGFNIPNFQSPATYHAGSDEGSGSSDEHSGSEEDEDDQNMDVDEDMEDADMRKRHGQFPERELKSFAELDEQYTEEMPSVSAFNQETTEAQRQAAPVSTQYYVKVERSNQVEASRRALPILMEEHQVMDAIRNNDFVIICGETGSGKTTQVPQFLYEAGFGDPNSPHAPGMIGITEPRRVAAISTAQRVAFELNQILPGESIDALEVKDKDSKYASASTSDAKKKSLPSKKGSSQDDTSISSPSTKHVAYQVRYDVTSDKNTRIKFMTDGILLREIQRDFLLNTYSVIVIDEAHERTMNTDLLLGLLCRLVPLRNELFAEGAHNVSSPLKVVIMSATLRVSDFLENHRMFPGKKPPVIKISARQFPVTIHFNRRTALETYVVDAYKKVVKIHSKLPEGGILVFLSGQAEILELVSMLRKRFSGVNSDTTLPQMEDDKEFFKFDSNIDLPDEDLIDDLEDDSEETLDESISYERGTDSSSSSSDGSGSDDESIDMDAKLVPRKVQMSDSESSEESVGHNKMDVDEKPKDPAASSKKKEKLRKEKFDQGEANKTMKVLVMPLYSMLSPKDQMRIFGSLAENTRLIVVATNIAETSLTIPGITYVVDAGRVKSKEYEKETGMTSYKVTWTSKASADQRAGRAGRTGPGHCYRLFSSAVYQTFNEFSRPDILNVPIEGVVLQMKHMGIERLETFPFPTPPDTQSLQTAHLSLLSLGALELPADDNNKHSTLLEASLNADLRITSLGRALVHFPVAPRYAKMLIIANQSNCLHWIVAIVSALSVGDPFDHSVAPEVRDPHKGIWRAWASSTSDLLVCLSAIGAYEYASDRESFCDNYKLHFKMMKEIRLLREQLHGILSFIFRDSDSLSSTIAPISTMEEDLDAEEMVLQEKLRQSKSSSSSDRPQQLAFNSKSWSKQKSSFDSKLDKPSNEQNLQIRQIIASGLLDHIAKRYPMLDEQGVAIKNRFEYRTVGAQKVCTIHPHSFLRAVPPEYVAYNELIETHESFITGITAISLGWMSELAPWMCKKMDVLLPLPKPRYEEYKDTIIGAVEPRYVYDDWVMPKTMVPLQGLDLYKHFARCLLEGDLCADLKQFGPFLNANSEIIFKLWNQPKVAAIVQPFVDKKIKTRSMLFQVWKTNPEFLLGAFALWLDKSKHSALKAMWPPLPKELKNQMASSSNISNKSQSSTKTSSTGIPSFGSHKPAKR